MKSRRLIALPAGFGPETNIYRLVRAARVAQVADLSVRMSGQESKNEPCNLVILLIQSESAGIEQMDLGIW
jgi:hypothetical protein